MSVREEILQRALELTPDDRAYVADQLEASLPTDSFVDHEIAAAWFEEIERRVEKYDRGESTALGFEEVLENMRQALAARRTSS